MSLLILLIHILILCFLVSLRKKIKIDFFFLSNKHRISEVIKSFSQEHCNRHIIQHNDYYQLHKKDDDFE